MPFGCWPLSPGRLLSPTGDEGIGVVYAGTDTALTVLTRALGLAGCREHSLSGFMPLTGKFSVVGILAIASRSRSYRWSELALIRNRRRRNRSLNLRRRCGRRLDHVEPHAALDAVGHGGSSAY